MKFGLTIFLTDSTIPAVDLGRALEEFGFESLFLPDHSHIPTSRLTPYRAGGDLPPEYWHLHDPLIALSSIAAVTTRLKLGTGVLVMTERDPIITAKQIASLDHVSEGRAIIGVGPGWNLEAMADHGVDPRQRTAVFAERVMAMRALWTMAEPEFHGRFVDFGPIWMWPKPIQQPSPPVLVAGYGPTALDRVLAFGDGWHASALHLDGEALRSKAEDLKRRTEALGRPTLPITLQLARSDAAAIDEYQTMGIDRCVFRLNPGAPIEVLDQIRQYDRLLKRWRS